MGHPPIFCTHVFPVPTSFLYPRLSCAHVFPVPTSFLCPPIFCTHLFLYPRLSCAHLFLYPPIFCAYLFSVPTYFLHPPLSCTHLFLYPRLSCTQHARTGTDYSYPPTYSVSRWVSRDGKSHGDLKTRDCIDRLDRPAVQLDRSFCDRQPEPGAAI